MSGLFEKAFWQAVDDADAGESKPLNSYLEFVPTGEQNELRALLAKVFAAQGPGTRPTPAQSESYARALDVIHRVRSETGSSGTLPGLLIQIRHSRGIERDHVVDRLTERFDLGGARDAVRRAYHQLESGQLLGSRLSRRLLAAIGDVFEIDPGDLEAASEPTGSPPSAQPAMAFGRGSDRQASVPSRVAGILARAPITEYVPCSPAAVTPDPEAAARSVLADFEARFDTQGVPPVPADRIAGSLLQLHIEEVDDVRSVPRAPSDRGALSGLVVSELQTIYLDRRECRRHPRRRRFTIAHEIGHWVLHISAGKLYGCRPADIVEQPRARPDTRELRRIEAEANRFAAELLMPETLVVAAANDLGSNVAALADRFDVSVPAIRVRLQQFGLLPAWMSGP